MSQITPEEMQRHLGLVGAAILVLYGPEGKILAVRPRLFTQGSAGLPHLELRILTPYARRTAANCKAPEEDFYNSAQGPMLSDAEICAFCTGYARHRIRAARTLDAAGGIIEGPACSLETLSNHKRLEAEVLLRRAELLPSTGAVA